MSKIIQTFLSVSSQTTERVLLSASPYEMSINDIQFSIMGL